MTIFKDNFLGENPDWKAACLFWKRDLRAEVSRPAHFRVTKIVGQNGISWARTYCGEEHAWQIALSTIHSYLCVNRRDD